jgi:hypothetical protein
MSKTKTIVLLRIVTLFIVQFNEEFYTYYLDDDYEHQYVCVACCLGECLHVLWLIVDGCPYCCCIGTCLKPPLPMLQPFFLFLLDVTL